MTAPPIGNGLTVEHMRRCCFDPSLCGEQACGRAGEFHVWWDPTLPDGHPDEAMAFNCPAHQIAAEKAGWLDAPAQTHEIGPDCGMPGSLWFQRADGSSFCTVPDDAPLATEAIAREAVAA